MNEKEFADSMAYLGMAYGKEYTKEELIIHYDFLKEYNDETLIKAIKKIIKSSKFLPKINELVEECENCKQELKFDVLEYMNQMGYFKASIEYEKASLFMERGIVPKWLQEDINRYYKMMINARLEHQEQKLIG